MEDSRELLSSTMLDYLPLSLRGGYRRRSNLLANLKQSPNYQGIASGKERSHNDNDAE
jgi:hypothetical protein